MSREMTVDPGEWFGDDGKEVHAQQDAEMQAALAPLDELARRPDLPPHIKLLQDIAAGRVPASLLRPSRILEKPGSPFLHLSPEEEGRWDRALIDFAREVGKYRGVFPDHMDVKRINPPRCAPERLAGLLQDLQNAAENESITAGDELLTFWSGGVAATSSDIIAEIKDGMVTIESTGDLLPGDLKTRTIPIRSARVLAWLHRKVFTTGVFMPELFQSPDSPKK